MLKNLSSLQVSVEGKQFVFSCDQDASLSSVYHSLSQMKSYVFTLIKKHEESDVSQDQQQVEPEVAPAEEPEIVI